ncbi:DUF1465 family protein [Novosphingobium piscinae]|uniref:DUF1465 family protein n=1 Tax=Novosphingobium piscinae TaxID=1507448 RepID=A0A7X1KRK2_9SPHN|nr:DUF1465 family protein [Novosphingobium piscinae]MBC2670886.1 DUF1465 family protein [Novosphingobium piscinae]
MTEPVNLNARIIEALYTEGLVLSDEVRAAFDLSPRACNDEREDTDAARLALSCEALRTTTRMMHSVAWLINHRAFFRNEISEFQLRRHGRIARHLPDSAPERLALLSAEIQALIRTTERFYARLVRLDAGWRARTEPGGQAPAIQRLRERLLHAVG